MKNFSAYIGYDSRWPLSYGVTVRSLLMHTQTTFPVFPLLLSHFQAMGFYDRPMVFHENQLYDTISEAPMATEFAISRFFIPFLAAYEGWSLFTDSDFLFRCDIKELFNQADDSKAIMCVKHNYAPDEKIKMGGQAQTLYSRKNWSSMMLINNAHPKNSILEPRLLNALPGRDLHAFSWLDDSDIGELGPEWNWLEGHSDMGIDPKIVHFTRGTPEMPGYENIPYADEWRTVAGGINLCVAKS